MQDNRIDWDGTRPVKDAEVDHRWSLRHSLMSAAIFLAGIVAIIVTMSVSP